MRTIIVVFTDRKVSLNEVSSYKKYKFLCNYDAVSLYDMVEDPRYTGKMMVVGFTCDTDRVQQGITLKDIYITKVNGQVINQPTGLVYGSLAGSDFDIDKQRTSNMEEKRNIKVTLEQAMEWYNSGNSTLRTLALSAYTEDELKFNLKYINSKYAIHASVPVFLLMKQRSTIHLQTWQSLLSSSMALGRKPQTIQDISLAISMLDVVL